MEVNYLDDQLQKYNLFSVMRARDVGKVEVNSGKNGFTQKKYQGGRSIYTKEIRRLPYPAYDLEDERAILAYDLEDERAILAYDLEDERAILAYVLEDERAILAYVLEEKRAILAYDLENIAIFAAHKPLNKRQFKGIPHTPPFLVPS